ncbi:MAG: helix-turn-helix domain-containing protein [Prevotella sp.]|nr:helix-turn-helix domain-containing protein [Prevotella sp.]
MTTHRIAYLIMGWMMAVLVHASNYHLLSLPHQEQLPSKKVLHLIEDHEGFLWYATEGGGICRDDGRQVDIFRSDNNHPELLGSNDVACLAEVQSSLIIGTFHGVYILDKKDYSIQRIKEVDDKRVDAICVASNGHYWLTSNRKIYEFSTDHTLLHTYPALWKGNGKYVADIIEDSHHDIWVALWDGGLLRWTAAKGQFEEMPWHSGSAPSAIVEDVTHRCFWIGTIGQGVVRYLSDTGDNAPQAQTYSKDASNHTSSICIDLLFDKEKSLLWMTTTEGLTLYDTSKGTLQPISLSHILPEGQLTLCRLSVDQRGNILVAGTIPHAFAICPDPYHKEEKGITDGTYRWQYHERQGVVVTNTTNGEKHLSRWGNSPLLPLINKRRNAEGVWVTDGKTLFANTWDTITEYASLPTRPNTLSDDGLGYVWFASNKGLQRLNLKTKEAEVIDANLQDISATAFTPDGTLWLANIYGQLYHFKDGKTTLDEYASNEYGDAILQLSIDSMGHLMLYSDKYVRHYDTQRHTLWSESLTTDDMYSIHLTTTQPYCRWSEPQRNAVVERLPRWMGSWWAWCIYLFLIGAIMTLFIHYLILRRQRHIFIERMKQSVEVSQKPQETPSDTPKEKSKTQADNLWLNLAIQTIEKNIDNEHYSVEQLSSDLCMSRMTFYRKIQALTGQKPTEFVRTIRLRRAAALLQEGRLNVTEISYATGFSSVSYFSRCFRTMFGVPPTQFGNDTTADSLSPNVTPS